MPRRPLHSLTDYAAKHPHASTVPDHLLRPAERFHDAGSFTPDDRTHNRITQAIGREALDYLNSSYPILIKVHKLIENYLKKNKLYPKLQDRMAGCREGGEVGYREAMDGSLERVIAFDHKCGLLRLCPFEARQEQTRMIRRYAKSIDDWTNKHPARRMQQCVLSVPHIKPKDLHHYKRELMKMGNQWIKHFPQVKGALITQEDPVSIDGQHFHVHLNVVLLIDGFYNWEHARMTWYELTKDLFPADANKMKKGWNAFFKDYTKQKDRSRVIRELVKYPVKFVSAELLYPDRKKSNKPKAPPLIEWEPHMFETWWEAGYGDWSTRKDGKPYRSSFRRTRSYGVLLSLEGMYWNDLYTNRKKQHLLFTLNLDRALMKNKWRQLPKEAREQLKEAMELQEVMPKSQVMWTGRIAFDKKKGKYCSPHITLTQADKSGSDPGRSDKFLQLHGQDPPTGPPVDLNSPQQRTKQARNG